MKILFFLSLVLLLSCEGNFASDEGKKTNTLSKVKLSEVISERNIRKLTFGGRVSSRNQSEQVSLIQGKIEKILVRSGQKVKKGQVLAVISPVTKGLSYNQYRVKASGQGTVLRSFKEAGSLVLENEVLFTIGNGYEYQVDVWGSIDDVLSVSNIKEVKIDLAPSSQYSKSLDGNLFSVSSLPDDKSGLYRIRVTFSCPKNEKDICNILARNSVWSRVNFEKDEGNILVLKDRFIPKWTKTLFILVDGDIAKKKKIKLGRSVVNGTVITEGLKEGDRVIVSYNRRPSDGEKVVVTSKKGN